MIFCMNCKFWINKEDIDFDWGKCEKLINELDICIDEDGEEDGGAQGIISVYTPEGFSCSLHKER